ncbi:MAG: copper oxidase [Methylococcaceae bacterium]|nr:copper oxidase [Methylococcaceae bacterium]
MNTQENFQRKTSAWPTLAAAIGLLCGASQAWAALPKVGVACTSGGPNPTFNLDTAIGNIPMPDGNSIFMWSYALTGQPFQTPGPVLCVNEGDTVTIVLHNKLAEPASIMFPGQENVTVGGQPVQPEITGTTITSLTNSAVPNGTVSYTFTASKPGTYIYESGTNPEKQVRMGLHGALIVRPTLGADYLFDRSDSRFTTTANSGTATPWNEEFMVLLSEIDPYQHQAEESGVYSFYDITQYRPRYWQLNGRGFPDAIADNAASWLPNQPYGALARVHPVDASHPYPGAIRYLNVGSLDYPFHPHGNNGLVIGRDGRPLAGPGGQDLSFEKFVVNVGPGQTWDVIFKWYDAENYSASNPVPMALPDPANLSYLDFYSGSPYLGQQGTLPPGITTVNQCGEFFIISHNHSLFQLNSWGLTMSGPATYMRVDPPLAAQGLNGILTCTY